MPCRRSYRGAGSRAAADDRLLLRSNSTEDVSSIDYVVTIDGVRGTEQHETIDPPVIPTRGGTLSIPLPLGEEAGSFQARSPATRGQLGHCSVVNSSMTRLRGYLSEKTPTVPCPTFDSDSLSWPLTGNCLG